MKITWPEQQIITVLGGILQAVERPFIANIKTSGTPCTICSTSGYLDPVTNTSVWSFCPECFGSYYTNTTSGILMSGHIRWYGSETPRWNSGGVIPDGDCLITVAFTEDLRTDIERAYNFEVDNKKLSLKKYTLKGAKNPNRILISLKEEAN